MDEIYDFKWLVGDIDASMIFMLRDGKDALGSYCINGLNMNGVEEPGVKFANISDLTNFINYTTVRFANSLNPEDVVDIPLRNILVLYENGNEIATEKARGLSLDELEGFGVFDGRVINNGYAIYAYKINEPSEELDVVMKLTHTFNGLSMNDKINALEDINLANYQRSRPKKQK